LSNGTGWPVWTSRRGLEREFNHDAGGLSIAGDQAIAVIVDEFTSSPSQGQMARELVCRLLQSWYVAPTVVCAEVSLMMQSIHTELRHQYRQSMAAYGILLTQKGSQTAFALVAGDCRIGSLQDSEAVWLTRPHTKEETLIRMGEKPAPGNRSTVTRCFKPRRWMEPETIVLEQKDDVTWAISTDGYSSATKVGGPIQSDDDASCIIFSWAGNGEPDTLDGNWYTVPC